MFMINVDGSGDLMSLESILSFFNPQIVKYWNSFLDSNTEISRLWHKDLYYIDFKKKGAFKVTKRLGIFIPFSKEKLCYYENNLMSEERLLRYLNMKAFW